LDLLFLANFALRREFTQVYAPRAGRAFVPNKYAVAA
jgi:hypothetical protein